MRFHFDATTKRIIIAVIHTVLIRIHFIKFNRVNLVFVLHFAVLMQLPVFDENQVAEFACKLLAIGVLSNVIVHIIDGVEVHFAQRTYHRFGGMQCCMHHQLFTLRKR